MAVENPGGGNSSGGASRQAAPTEGRYQIKRFSEDADGYMLVDIQGKSM